MVEIAPRYEKNNRNFFRFSPWSARDPSPMYTKHWINTDIDMVYKEKLAVSTNPAPYFVTHWYPFIEVLQGVTWSNWNPASLARFSNIIGINADIATTLYTSV